MVLNYMRGYLRKFAADAFLIFYTLTSKEPSTIPKVFNESTIRVWTEQLPPADGVLDASAYRAAMEAFGALYII
jgi:hypothetical protein